MEFLPLQAEAAMPGVTDDSWGRHGPMAFGRVPVLLTENLFALIGE